MEHNAIDTSFCTVSIEDHEYPFLIEFYPLSTHVFVGGKHMGDIPLRAHQMVGLHMLKGLQMTVGLHRVHYSLNILSYQTLQIDGRVMRFSAGDWDALAVALIRA